MENERTVLVVDDDAKLRSLLKDFLQGEHWQVRTAADGLEALAAVRAQRPSIIILDLMMPKLDGTRNWG
jgi:DNA-binding response OmpR family regulator